MGCCQSREPGCSGMGEYSVYLAGYERCRVAIIAHFLTVVRLLGRGWQSSLIVDLAFEEELMRSSRTGDIMLFTPLLFLLRVWLGMELLGAISLCC